MYKQTSILMILFVVLTLSGFMAGCSDDDNSPVTPSLTPEIISVSYDTQGVLTREFQLRVTAERTESMALYLDGNLVSTLDESPWNWTFDPLMLPTGDHEFIFIAMAGDEQVSFTRWLATSNGVIPGVGMPAPDFRLLDAAGDIVQFSQLRGDRPVLLSFWATWCYWCLEELPDLQAAQETYGPRGLLVLTVDTEFETEPGAQLLQDGGYTFDALFDSNLRVLRDMYLGSAFPTNLLIDRDGLVVKRGYGGFPDYISADDFEGVLEMPIESELKP